MFALNHYVEIQRSTGAVGSMTAPPQWEAVASVWAAFGPVRDKNSDNANRDTSIADVKVTIRWRNDVQVGMQILYDGRVFDILNIQNKYEKNRILELLCRELI